MRKLLASAAFALALAWAGAAEASTCFWVGGTGTWDTSNTASWSSSTGGTASTCAATGGIPKQTVDVATFDGSSGGGTVTVNSNFSIATLTTGAFTGTLDFSANNNSITLSTTFNGSGSGTRTLNMGNGTWTVGGGATGTSFTIATTTGLTFHANSSVINITGQTNGVSVVGLGGLTYNTVNLQSNTGSSFSVTGANTFANLGVAAGAYVVFVQGSTQTVTNAFTWTGTSGSQIGIVSAAPGTAATISVATGSPTMSWAAVHDMTFTGGATFTATNSFNLNHNSGISITAPTGGGSSNVCIIGG